MGGFQKVTIIGTVTMDPEMQYTGSGMAVATVNVVTSYKKKDSGEDVPSFHRIKAFGKQAEVVGQYLVKGKGIHVECELQYGKYQHKAHQDVTIYTTDLILKTFTFLPGSGGGNNQGQKQQGGTGGCQQNGGQGYQPQGQPQNNNQGYQPRMPQGGVDPQDDIPF